MIAREKNKESKSITATYTAVILMNWSISIKVWSESFPQIPAESFLRKWRIS